MSDKCSAHENCMDRIHETMGELRDDLHKGVSEIKDLLHAGAILHTRLDMRIEQCEGEIQRLRAKKQTDWKAMTLNLLFGLVEKGIVVLIAMAYYGHKQGWGE